MTADKSSFIVKKVETLQELKSTHSVRLKVFIEIEGFPLEAEFDAVDKDKNTIYWTVFDSNSSEKNSIGTISRHF